MNVGAKIRELRLQRGLSPEKLAMLVGISGIYIRRLERGERRTITLATAEKLAKGLKVKPEVFFEDEEIRNPNPEQALSDIEVSIRAYIPVYAEVSAGEGIEPIDYVAVTRSRPAPDSLRAYRVKGLCLAPEIAEGDTVLVDTALPQDIGRLLVCFIDGVVSIKRLCADEKGERYLQNNFGKYRPEECKVLGVVVGVYKSL